MGSFLRTFTFGHVRQLDAVASRFLTALAKDTSLVAGVSEVAVVDIDDTIVEVHGYAKQGAGFGYSGVRGLNALLATVTTAGSAPVVVAEPAAVPAPTRTAAPRHLASAPSRTPALPRS